MTLPSLPLSPAGAPANPLAQAPETGASVRLAAREPALALNTVCPYFSMFPLEYPFAVLDGPAAGAHSVLDPFCGRGTTLYAARIRGRTAWGVDTSPVAVAVSRAKLATCQVEAVLVLAAELIERYAGTPVPQTEFFTQAFDARTLGQLCALRQGLLEASGCSGAQDVLRALALGCLHGPLSVDPDNAAYFSNQMPRTFCPKPQSNLRHWAHSGQRAPRADVVQVLGRRLARLARSLQEAPSLEDATPNGATRCVAQADSADERTLPELLGGQRIDCVITSPPYFGMRTYVADQWLRHWFLGGPDTPSWAGGAQLAQGSEQSFAQALGRVWANCARAAPGPLSLFVRLGNIPSRRIDVRALMAASLAASGEPWVLHSAVPYESSRGGRQARQMGAGAARFDEFDFHYELLR